MHRDVFGDDGLFQHPGLADGERLGAAAAGARKQGVLRHQNYVLGGGLGIGLVCGGHIQIGQSDLAVKDLHPPDGERIVARRRGLDVHGGVGPHGGVVFVQRIAGRRGGDRNVRPDAVGVGENGHIQAVAGDVYRHIGHRAGKTGREAAQPQGALAGYRARAADAVRIAHMQSLLCGKRLRAQLPRDIRPCAMPGAAYSGFGRRVRRPGPSWQGEDFVLY